MAVRVLGSYDNGGEGAAEIVAHDPDSQRLFVVDAAAGALLILDATDMSHIDTIDVAADGDPNSVAVRPGTGSGDALVAVALADGTNLGRVGLYDIDGTQLSLVTVGDIGADGQDANDASLPDMVTFTPDGDTLLVANEGEYDPGDQTVAADDTDPEGSVSLIDVSAADPTTIAQGDVTELDFRAYNSGESDDLSGAIGDEGSGFHFDPTAGSIGQDIEPEYIAVTGDSSTAYVTLQEVNAVAVIDIAGAAVTNILPLGHLDRSVAGNGLDGSDDDGAINIATYDGLFGMRMPDAIAVHEDGGDTWFLTANEGDARALDVEGVPYDSDAAEQKIEDVTLDPVLDPADIATDDTAGQLLVTPHLGDTGGDAAFEELYSFGTRSFTIFDDAGNVVFDSGDDFEQLIAERFPEAFNADDPIEQDGDDLASDFDNRSDNKGPEPEGITVGTIGTQTYAFIGLERQGGVMMYDITTPANATFVDYITTRNLSDYVNGIIDPAQLLDPEATGGDWSPEGLAFIDAADSPTGRAALVAAHEVSGTVTMFDLGTFLTEPAAAASPAASLPTYQTTRTRLAGADRVRTAIEIAEHAYPGGADVVVLARRDVYADALIGGPLAAGLDAPILLTRSDELEGVVLDALDDLGTQSVLLLGGEGALSADVDDALKAAGRVTRRIGGDTRFETAQLIAEEVAPDGSDVVYVVEGINADDFRGWPDALSVAPLAAFQAAPIAPVRADLIPAAAQSIIDDADAGEVVVIGGPAAVNDIVFDALVAQDEGRTVRRLSGPSRYATNGAVYDEALAQGMDPTTRWLATGLKFPDALTAGAAAGAAENPLVLGHGRDLGREADTMARLTSLPEARDEILVIGGNAAISLEGEAVLAAALEAPDAPDADLCLTVLHNNDGESQLIDAGRGLESFGGAARFATRLLTERARGSIARDGCDEVGTLTVTSGDNFLAGPEWAASQANGVPFHDSRLYDYLDYDAIDLGNHDFDFGPDTAADFIAGFTDDTPFLSANLDPSREPALAAQVNLGRLRPSTTVDIGSHSVGVIGLTTPTLPLISSPREVGVFGLGTDADPQAEDLDLLADFVAGEAAALSADGADIIVVISHLQGVDTDLDLVPRLSGVDIVVAGGGDEVLANPGDPLVTGHNGDVYGTYPLEVLDADGATVPVVTTAGSYTYVGRLVARFDAAGDLLGTDGDSRMVRVAGGALFDAVVPDSWVDTNVVTPVRAFIDGLASNVIATSTVDLDGVRSRVRTQETNVGNLLTDALAWLAERDGAAFGLDPSAEVVAIANGGGIRNDSVIPAGNVTMLDTFDIAPFPNFVAAFEGVTAAELDTLFEHTYGQIEFTDGRFAQVSGLEVTVDPSAPSGSRVSSVTLTGGVPIPPAGVTLVMPDFSARGGDGYPVAGFGDFTVLGTSYQEALAQFIAAPNGLDGTISAPTYKVVAEGGGNAARILYP